MRGDIVPAIAGPVALGSVAGSLLDARILMRVPERTPAPVVRGGAARACGADVGECVGHAERFVMQPSDERTVRLELRLARLLWNGTGIASLVVAAGLALAAIGPSGPGRWSGRARSRRDSRSSSSCRWREW
jgi:hypothetical protein